MNMLKTIEEVYLTNVGTSCEILFIFIGTEIYNSTIFKAHMNTTTGNH